MPKETHRVSELREPLQEKLAKALPEEYQQGKPAVAGDSKGSLLLVVVGCYYSHFEHHRGSSGACSLVRCYYHHRWKTPLQNNRPIPSTKGSCLLPPPRS